MAVTHHLIMSGAKIQRPTVYYLGIAAAAAATWAHLGAFVYHDQSLVLPSTSQPVTGWLAVTAG